MNSPICQYSNPNLGGCTDKIDVCPWTANTQGRRFSRPASNLLWTTKAGIAWLRKMIGQTLHLCAVFVCTNMCKFEPICIQILTPWRDVLFCLVLMHTSKIITKLKKKLKTKMGKKAQTTGWSTIHHRADLKKKYLNKLIMRPFFKSTKWHNVITCTIYMG